MFKWLLMLLVSISLWAENPKIYAVLGDPVYNDIPKIRQLADVKVMVKERYNIIRYLKKAEDTKKLGIALDNDNAGFLNKKDYLVAVRYLDHEHKRYLRLAETAVKNAIQEEDYPSFAQLIESGLIDIEANEEEIFGFYEAYRDDTNISLLDEHLQALQMQESLKQKEKAKRSSGYTSSKQRRLDQIHARQKAAKEARQKAIDEEMERKKMEAHRLQKEELKFSE